MNNDRKKQLDDANVVIMGLTDKYLPKHKAYEWALNYREKYFPPKRTLHEKFTEYHNWMIGYQESDDAYTETKVFAKFKEIFKDEMDPTVALSEAKSYFGNYTDGSVFSIDEIRTFINNLIRKYSADKDDENEN